MIKRTRRERCASPRLQTQPHIHDDRLAGKGRSESSHSRQRPPHSLRKALQGIRGPAEDSGSGTRFRNLIEEHANRPTRCCASTYVPSYNRRANPLIKSPKNTLKTRQRVSAAQLNRTTAQGEV
jgi:hypothetical protein